MPLKLTASTQHYTSTQLREHTLFDNVLSIENIIKSRDLQVT